MVIKLLCLFLICQKNTANKANQQIRTKMMMIAHSKAVQQQQALKKGKFQIFLTFWQRLMNQFILPFIRCIIIQTHFMVQRTQKQIFTHITFNHQQPTPKTNSLQTKHRFTNTDSFPHNKNIFTSLDPLSLKWKTANKIHTNKNYHKTERKQIINRVLIDASFELQNHKSRTRVYIKPKPERSFNEKEISKEKAISQLLHGKFSLKKKYSIETTHSYQEFQGKANSMIEIKTPFFANKNVSNSEEKSNGQSITFPQTQSNSLAQSIIILDKFKNKKCSQHLGKVQEIKRSTPVYCLTVKKREKMLSINRGFSLLRTKTQQIHIDDVSGWKDLHDDQDDLTSTQATST